MAELPDLDMTYVVVKRLDRAAESRAISIEAHISIGQRIRFIADYHGGGPWAFDHPVELWVVDADILAEHGDYKILARLHPFSWNMVFDFPRGSRNTAYLIVDEHRWKAIEAGVPPEDVLA